MTIKIKDFINIMEKIAPDNLKESYDNVGLMIGDRDDDVSGILVALDITLEVIEEAKEKGANLILTHHPILYLKPSTITMDTLQGEKIIRLIRENINVYSSHTNLDVVNGGLTDKALELLGFPKGKIMDVNPLNSSAGVGRIVKLEEEMILKEVCRLVRSKLSIPYMKVAGDPYKKVKIIAVLNGSGQDLMKKAYNMGADLFITGDTTYHYVSDYKEMGMSVIDIGHFSFEWPLFKAVVNKVEEDLKEAYGEGIKIYYSDKNNEPYWIY